MAKDNRQILRGIRIPVARPNAKPDKDGVIHKLASVIYKDGMEDELAAAVTQEKLDAMVERGDLRGEWKAVAATEPAAKPKAASKSAPPAP